MGRITVLGSANAVPDGTRENTHLLVQAEQNTVLVDCVSSPIQRLKQAGVNPLALTDLIVTHFHPDHVSGVPLLLMSLWLMGRTQPVDVYGLADTMDRLEAMMDLYEWRNWPGFFTVRYHRIPPDERFLVIERPDLRVYASPVKHLIPTIGLRFEFPRSGKSAAYSCDTEPCDEVVRLAQGVDVLIHEATGGGVGHTSPAQAGQIAARAGAKQLTMIHYPDPAGMLAEAQKYFPRPVALAVEWMRIDLD